MAQWNHDGHNVCIPYENRPNRGRRIRTYPVVERNESVYIWYDAERRDPYFDVPDVFAGFDDGSSVADYYPMATLYRERLELHPQYVLENGVDFAHFKFVHKTPIVPVFTRHDFDRPVSYVDFTITFEGDDGQSIEDVKSGVEAINGGLGVAVTKSWGMVDNRTITAVTPVDDGTSDVRFSVYIGRTASSDPAKAERKAQEFAQEIIRQFTQDVHIWQHQRYSDPPALSSSEYEGFTAIRNWAKQFYPDDRGGSAAELRTAVATPPAQ
jgi:phenylpropionate dioxygenase-like ring-hydroxylating dioxygenase large terminal subunit